MKKALVFLTSFLLVVSFPTIPNVPAQMSAPISAPVVVSSSVTSSVPVVPANLDRVGVVAAAAGKVELISSGQASRVAQSGDPVFMGDEVKTDASGRLQILLLDETVFTIGPNSTIIIDKFVYDPKSNKGEIKASITKGVFRYVSGKIAAKNPDAVKVKLPAATLGFRGTIVGGSVGANGQGLAALLGPGANNDAGAPGGNFTIEGTGGGFQSVSRTGFGVEFDGNGGVSGVFQLSGDQINGLTGGLGGGAPGGGGQGSGGGNENGFGGGSNMGDLSGENNALGGMNGTLINGLSGLADGLYAQSVIGAQDAAQNNVSTTSNANGITTAAELNSVASGSYSYSFSSADFFTTVSSGAPQSPAILGSMSANWTLNFDSKILENISVTITSPDSSGIGYPSETTDFNNVPFSDLPENGNAVFTPTISGGNPYMSAEITFKNVDGQIAQQGEIKVNYNDSPSWIGNGNATAEAGSGGAVIVAGPY
jgi:hypothetical protein